MSKLLRVTQLDAVQLDNEISKILRLTFEIATDYVTPSVLVPIEPEINLIFSCLVQINSILRNNCTFGQQLLLLKYDNLTNVKKLLYLLISCSSYIKERVELSKPGHTFNAVIDFVESVWKIAAFINISIFLRTGSKPRLIDRLLGLEQVYSVDNIQRNFGNNKYLTRELLWNGFIELLLFVIPLINYHKLKRKVRQLNPFYKNVKKNTSKSNTRYCNLYTKCAHCNNSPILPHHMGCEHVFCYVCLKSNVIADDKYECPACGYSGNLCEKVFMGL